MSGSQQIFITPRLQRMLQVADVNEAGDGLILKTGSSPAAEPEAQLAGVA